MRATTPSRPSGSGGANQKVVSSSSSFLLRRSSPPSDSRDLEDFHRSMRQLTANLPLTTILVTRNSLKFLSPLSEMEQVKCHSLMAYTRGYLYSAWFLEPTMSNEKLFDYYLHTAFVMSDIITDDFYKYVFLVQAKCLIERSWLDFKREQYQFWYRLFINGGDYRYLRK